jgi:hypothetical protein
MLHRILDQALAKNDGLLPSSRDKCAYIRDLFVASVRLTPSSFFGHNPA